MSCLPVHRWQPPGAASCKLDLLLGLGFRVELRVSDFAVGIFSRQDWRSGGVFTAKFRTAPPGGFMEALGPSFQMDHYVTT